MSIDGSEIDNEHYFSLLEDEYLPSLSLHNDAPPLFPLATVIPEFFVQNLLSDSRVIKLIECYPRCHDCLLRCFYFQLLKLCFEIEVEEKNYLAITKKVIFDPTILIEEYSRLYKKHIAVFLYSIETEGETNFYAYLNCYPGVDKAFLHVLYTFLSYYLPHSDDPSDILAYLSEIFEINFTATPPCFKFEESDVFLYCESTEKIYICYDSPVYCKSDSGDADISNYSLSDPPFPVIDIVLTEQTPPKKPSPPREQIETTRQRIENKLGGLMNNNGPLLSSIAENDVNASFGTAMFQSYDESLGVSNIAGNSSLHHSKPDTLINIVDAECSNSAMLQSACNQSREEKYTYIKKRGDGFLKPMTFRDGSPDKYDNDSFNDKPMIDFFTPKIEEVRPVANFYRKLSPPPIIIPEPYPLMDFPSHGMTSFQNCSPIPSYHQEESLNSDLANSSNTRPRFPSLEDDMPKDLYDIAGEEKNSQIFLGDEQDRLEPSHSEGASQPSEKIVIYRRDKDYTNQLEEMQEKHPFEQKYSQSYEYDEYNRYTQKEYPNKGDQLGYQIYTNEQYYKQEYYFNEEIYRRVSQDSENQVREESDGYQGYKNYMKLTDSSRFTLVDELTRKPIYSDKGTTQVLTKTEYIFFNPRPVCPIEPFNVTQAERDTSDDSVGIYYRQFTNTRIIKLLREPQRTKVQLIRNRFRGYHMKQHTYTKQKF